MEPLWGVLLLLPLGVVAETAQPPDRWRVLALWHGRDEVPMMWCGLALLALAAATIGEIVHQRRKRRQERRRSGAQRS